jgi:hypothetical protein
MRTTTSRMKCVGYVGPAISLNTTSLRQHESPVKLHDEIIDHLPADFVRRMRNWSRTIDGTPISVAWLKERVDHSRGEQPLPTLLGEANDTHKAVQALPQRYQEVVTVFWTHLSRDMKWMSKATPRLRLWALGPESFREWLENAHDRLQREIAKVPQ